MLPVSFCHIFKAMTLGFKGPGQQFSTGGVCASGGGGLWTKTCRDDIIISYFEKEPRVFASQNTKGMGFL